MSILATCSCGKAFRAKDHHAGQRARCPTCGGTFLVPMANDPLEVPDAPASAAERPAWIAPMDSAVEEAVKPADAGIIAGNPFGARDFPGPLSLAGDWAPRVAVLAALVLYAVAFFLPAIQSASRVGPNLWQPNHPIHSGMQAFALAIFPGIFVPPLAMSWFANPLFLVGVVLAWLRQWLAAAIAAFSSSALAILGGISMVYLATLRVQCDKQVSETRFEPREGYYAWLTAMLLLGLVCLAWSRLAPPPTDTANRPKLLLILAVAIGITLLLAAGFFVTGLSVDSSGDR